MAEQEVCMPVLGRVCLLTTLFCLFGVSLFVLLIGWMQFVWLYYYSLRLCFIFFACRSCVVHVRARPVLVVWFMQPSMAVFMAQIREQQRQQNEMILHLAKMVENNVGSPRPAVSRPVLSRPMQQVLECTPI